jgi:hypothetical protein
MVQLRQELGLRIVDKVFDPKTDKPTKVHYPNNYYIHVQYFMQYNTTLHFQLYIIIVVDVFCEEKIHGQKSIGTWSIKQFCKYQSQLNISFETLKQCILSLLKTFISFRLGKTEFSC